VLVAELVFMVSWITVSGDPSGSFATSLAGVDALAMGMQSCAVGSLELKGIFTTAVTATLVNLSRGAADRRASTTQAAQLVRILVSLVIGAFLGGLLLVNAPTLAPVIPPIATAVAIAGSLNHRRAVRRGASESDLATIDGNRAAPVAPVDPALGLGEAA
jgi:uncharacterized membrane protein YoaK (UPF0700 family)